jgi:hypothetical protein
MIKHRKKDITDKLKETGFPLEVTTFNLFDSLGMDTRPSESYVDRDTKKNREIDIHVLDFYPDMTGVLLGDKADTNRLIVHYVVECKQNNAHSWVFFTNTTRHWLSPRDLNVKMKEDFYLNPENIESALNEFHGKEKIHISFTEIPTKDRSTVYETISGVLKATNYFKDLFATDNVIHLFVPIIVVGGSLWSATMTGKTSSSPIRLKRAKYISGIYNSLDSEQKYDSNDLYFVVTEKYLPSFLKKFRKVGTSIHNEWIKSAPVKKARVSRKTKISH